MSHRTVTKDGRTLWLRPAAQDDAQTIIQAVDSVAREGRYFLRSRFEMDVEKEQAHIRKATEQGNLFLLAVLDEPDGQLVGWVTLFRAQQEFRQHNAELGMGVLRGYRGIGVGAALMEVALHWAAEHDIEKVNLGVRASNTRAQTLYRKFGFVPEGRRLRDIKDLQGRYDDTVEMSVFAQAPEKET